MIKSTLIIIVIGKLIDPFETILLFQYQIYVWNMIFAQIISTFIRLHGISINTFGAILKTL